MSSPSSHEIKVWTVVGNRSMEQSHTAVALRTIRIRCVPHIVGIEGKKKKLKTKESRGRRKREKVTKRLNKFEINYIVRRHLSVWWVVVDVFDFALHCFFFRPISCSLLTVFISHLSSSVRICEPITWCDIVCSNVLFWVWGYALCRDIYNHFRHLFVNFFFSSSF